MDRRLAGMLVAATALHVAVYAVTAATGRPTHDSGARLHAAPLELTEIVSVENIENTAEPLPETETVPAAPDVPTGGVAAPGIVAPRVAIKSKPSAASNTELTSPTGTDVAGPEISAQNGTEPVAPTKPKIPPLIDLGSPGKHAIILPQPGTGADAPPISKEKQLEAKLDAQLKAGLDAKDTEAGTGYGGPVASAAHGAAQGSLAPEAGFATFDVQTDAAGTITGVKLVDFNADKAGWEYVASGMRKTLSTQKLRVPTGANGVYVRVRVEASMKLPSGAKKGVQVQGLGFGFDVADIGQQPKRVVSARVLSEQRI